MNINAKAFTPDAGSFGEERSRGGLRVAASEFVVPVADPTPPQVVPLSLTAKAFVPLSSVPLCRFFARGVCHKGLDCPFLHDSDSALKSGRWLSKKAEKESEEQSSRTTLEYEVDDGITCCFGPGAAVVRLDLGSSLQAAASSSVIITGLKIGVSEHDVESRLSPFGTLLSLQVKQNTGSAVVFAKATFSEPNAALLASGALNGTPLKTWIGLCGASKSRTVGTGSTMDPVSVTALSKLRTMGSSAVSVKLQWYAPSKFCWVHFDHRFQAEKAAKTLHGIGFHGRQLEARFQQPSRRQTTKFTVWLGNLPPEATAEKITCFLRRSVKIKLSVELGNPPYLERDGQFLIQGVLRKFGPLSSFEASDDTTTLK